MAAVTSGPYHPSAGGFMGLFSKNKYLTDDDPLPKVTSSTIPTPPAPSSTPVSTRNQVCVTAADPNGPPSQVIERRAPLVDPSTPVTAPIAAHAPSMPPNPNAGTPRFGIDDAIRLLRELPGRESSAVREAVQKTLQFMNVDLERL